MADAEDLRRLAHLMLAPIPGRRRRVALASAAADRAAGAADPVAALVADVLQTGGRRGLALLGHPRLAGREGAVRRELAALDPAARAAWLLANLGHRTPEEISEILRSAGVFDPETSLSLADRSPLDPATVRAMSIPERPRPLNRRRLVIAAIAAAALGVTAPMIAMAAGSGSHPREGGLSRPLHDGGPPAATPSGAAQPGAAQPGVAPHSVVYDLAQLLVRLDDRLRRNQDPPAARQKLQALRDAVAARLAELTR